MVSGAVVWRSAVSSLACRGGWGGCYEVRGDLKNLVLGAAVRSDGKI